MSELLMMTGMGGRIAHAIYDEIERQGCEAGSATISFQHGKLWIDGELGVSLQDLIAAILKEMEKPTEATTEAGLEVYWNLVRDDEDDSRIVREVFSAMLHGSPVASPAE